MNTATLVHGRHKETNLGEVPQSPAAITVAMGKHDSRQIGLTKLTNGAEELARLDHHRHSRKDIVVPLGHPLHSCGLWRCLMVWKFVERAASSAIAAVVGMAAASALAVVALQVASGLLEHPHHKLVNLSGRIMVVQSLEAWGAAEHVVAMAVAVAQDKEAAVKFAVPIAVDAVAIA